MSSGALVVDNTLVTDYVTCEMKGVMRHVLGLTGLGEKVKMQMGTDGHAALATYFQTGGDRERALAEFDGRYKVYADGDASRAGAVDPNAKGLAGYTWTNARRVVEYWLTTHPIERLPFVVQRPEDVECVIDPPVFVGNLESGVNVFLTGLLDLLVTQRLGGGRFVLDHKFTGSNLTDWYKDRHRWGSQFTGYTYAKRRHGVIGAFANIIQVKEVPNSDRKCYEHKKPYRECGLLHLQTWVEPIVVTDHQIEKWRQTFVQHAGVHLKWKERLAVEDEPLGVVGKEVPQQGRFTGACGMCEMQRWCNSQCPSDPVEVEKMVEYAPWEPLAEGRARRMVA